MIWALRERKAAQASAVHATTQAARSEQVAHFLEDMLKGVGPSVALGRDTTMLREIVDKTAERIQTDLKDQPDVQIELDLTLTEVYLQLQDYKKMEQTARQTLALARSHLGAESLPAADALWKLGIALSVMRSLDEAETVTRQAIAMQRKLRGGESLEEGEALCTLGNVLRHQAGRTERPVSARKRSEAESANKAGLAILRKRLGNDSDEVSFSLYLLSMTLMDAGKAAEAEDAIRESAAIRQRIHGDDYPSAQFGFMTYILLARGKLDEAEACGRKALEIERKMGLVGKQSQVGAHFNLGQVLLAKGKPDEAETHYREAVMIARKVVDSEYRDLPGWLAGLANVLRKNGKLAEARPLAEEAVAICDRHPDQVELWARDSAISTLGVVLSDLGDSAALEALATQVINRAELADNPDQLATTYARTIPLLVSAKRQEQARDLCRKILGLTFKDGGEVNSLAWFLATAENPAHRDPAMAVELAKRAVELSPQSGGIWNTLGVARYRAGEWQAAVDALQKSMELRGGGDAFDWLFLAMAHQQLGNKDEAGKWYDKAVEWRDKNQPNNEEFRRFRAEAEELLRVEPAVANQQPEKTEKPE
jgi:tetratricopeptide (TPR) repeat protein